MRSVPRFRRLARLCVALVVAMVLVSVAWAWQVKDLSRRWPSVAPDLAAALLERLESDPQLLRDVKARELAVLDSLRLRQWVLPKGLEAGEVRLSAGAGGDTLAAWASLSSLWQGGLDSVVKDPDVLTRADEEASRASIERLAGEVRPSREDRLLAAHGLKPPLLTRMTIWQLRNSRARMTILML